MLMAATAAAAYMQTDSTTISPPPWYPAVPVAIHQHQSALYELDLAAAPPSPSLSPPRPRNHHLQQLRPGSVRRPSSRRRPRPSRKVPTTYITADPASFRRMVHQVTGAVDLLPPPLAPPHHEATTLCRPAPYRAVAAGALVTTLPTLDTSALLLGSSGCSRTVSGPARRTTRPVATVPPAASEVDVGAGGGVRAGAGVRGAGYGSIDCGGGFPTLESWDALLY